MTVQENKASYNNPQVVINNLTKLKDFLWDDLQENLIVWWDDALSKIISKLKINIFSPSEKYLVEPSEIVAVLWSILRQAQAKYINFPEFDIQKHQDSSIHASLEAYLDTLKDYIDTYREDFDPKKKFDSEDKAVKYVKKCGIGNVKNVILNPLNSAIVNIISDDIQPLTGLESINKKFTDLWNVWTVFFSQDSVTLRSIEWTQIEWLGTLDDTVSGISGAWGAQYDISSWNIVSIYSKPDKYLAFADKIWELDLSKIACVISCEFDEQKRIKRISFGEWVTWLEETWLDILSDELSTSENLKNAMCIWLLYDSNKVVVEYHDQHEAKSFPIS